MTKKWVYWDHNPGLRLLRSLTPGYLLSPFQGWDLRPEVFYRAHRTLNAEGPRGWSNGMEALPRGE